MISVGWTMAWMSVAGVVTMPNVVTTPRVTEIPEAGAVCGVAPVPLIVHQGYASAAGRGGPTNRDAGSAELGIIAPLEAPEYYRFQLVTTGRLPGTGLATGSAQVLFSESPFGIAIAEDGSYLYDVGLELAGLHLPPEGVLTVWFARSDLGQVERSGVIEPGVAFWGRVGWNKFLVVITLEATEDPNATMWSGPVVLRGMSRSGAMHTMAGHGPFEQENCATFGYR